MNSLPLTNRSDDKEMSPMFTEGLLNAEKEGGSANVHVLVTNIPTDRCQKDTRRALETLQGPVVVQ